MQKYTFEEQNRILSAKKAILDIDPSKNISLSFSGGKDSTCVLFLILELISEKKLDPERVNIVHSDTTIEYPKLSSLTFKVLYYLRDLNLKVDIVRAKPEKRFFSLLFGRGYPRPMHSVRWCTQYLKIQPQTEHRKLSKNNIVVTGEHLGESQKRDSKLNKINSCGSAECGLKEITNSLKNDEMVRPILNWKTCQIWDYLMSVDGLLWEGMIWELDNIYKNTNSTDSLRTGCIACPVISRKRHEDTDSKGIPSELSLRLYHIYNVLSEDKYRLKNPKIGSLHPDLKDYRDKLNVRHLNYEQLTDFFKGRVNEIGLKSNGLYSMGSIALPVRRILWKKVEELIPEFKKCGVDLISIEEHQFILKALRNGYYPVSYKPEMIKFLEEEWKQRTGY